MNIKYKRLILITIILAIISYVYYTFPRKFEKEYDAIEYRLGNLEYEKTFSVKINGWYTRKIFTNDYFQGSINIGDIKLSRLKLSIDGIEPLIGLNESTSKPDSFGTIYIGKEFKEFTISVYEEGDKPGSKQWNGKDGLMISAPSVNRKKALDLSNKLMNKFWDDEINLK